MVFSVSYLALGSCVSVYGCSCLVTKSSWELHHPVEGILIRAMILCLPYHIKLR